MIVENSIITQLKNSPHETEVGKAFDSKTVHAIAVVINYTISDTFDLTMEESIWTGWILQDVLQPLSEIHTESIQAAVKQELSTFIYSNMLFERDQERGSIHKQMKNVKYASLDEWTKAITEIIFASYPDLRPMVAARIIGSISGLFTELGLTNDKTSRASLYLPTTVRHIIASREDLFAVA